VNIGISQRVDKVNTYDEWRDAIDQRLIKWVVKAGFVPIPIPNNLIELTQPKNKLSLLDYWLQELNIDALLLSGGNDIGNTPHRDLTESYLLSWAEKNKIPTLGICRGMQMMGVYSGAKLINVNNHVGVRHQLKIVSDSKVKLPDTVNSYHNQRLQSCPNSFNILAKSEDGSIEAIVHKDLPWEAWMWHPERDDIFSKGDLDRFKNLLENERQ
jgi:putative glutamine amidotransferase